MNDEEDTTVDAAGRQVSPTARMSCTSSAKTDIGCKRLHNEDAYLASNSKGLWAVADGMGGHDAGDLASRTVIHNLDRVMISEDLDESVQSIEQSVKASNTELQTIARDLENKSMIGTTLALLVSRGQQGVVMWAGDSRVYRLRDEQLEQLSNDHSVVNDLVAKGVLDAADAEAHPDANKITRSIGIRDHVELETRKVSILPDDRYILCSDGLTRYITDRQICMLASPAVNNASKEAASALLQAALEAGTGDNVTVIVIDFRGAA